MCAHRPILVCAANGLIGFVTYMYLTVLAPVYLTPRLGATGTACVVCVAGLHSGPVRIAAPTTHAAAATAGDP